MAGSWRRGPAMTAPRIITATFAAVLALAAAAPLAGAAARQAPGSALALRAVAGEGSITLSWNPVALRFRVIDVTGPQPLLLADGTRATAITVTGLEPGVVHTFRVTALVPGGPSAVVSAAALASTATPAGPPDATGRRPAGATRMPRAPSPPRAHSRDRRVVLALPPAGRGSRLVVFRAGRTGIYRRIGSTRRRRYIDRTATPGRIARYRLVRVNAAGLASAASAATTVRVRR
jgi:hypothetical protein